MAVGVTIDRPKSKKKIETINKVKGLVETYNSIILFNCDNVGTNQLKKVRVLVREHGVLIMGKNSLFKKAFLAKGHNASKFERVLSHLYGNIGLFFTNKNLKEMRDILESISAQAPVKAGMIAQCDVVIPKGLTSIPPERTNFFQALRISTSINKSCIEIMSDVNLMKKGQKVGASEASLLQMLDIRPFSYKLISKFIFDNGMCYPPVVLDIKPSDIIHSFQTALGDIASISLEINYPTRASIPHLIQNAAKDLLAICLEVEIDNDYVAKFKTMAASASTVTSVQPSAGQNTATTKAEPTKAPESEESDEDMGLGLFD